MSTLEAKVSTRTLTRVQKLTRWADLIDKHPATVATLPGTEYATDDVRDTVRADGSAISIAAADPLFKAMGLVGDTYGDAKRFFELTDDELHDAVCHCHYHGWSHIAPAAMASRIRNIVRSTVWSA